jgi:hypothetical protein
MPFAVTNAPATFQSYIDDCLRSYIDDFAVCYVDDILTYSTYENEHDQHRQKVVERLQEFSLDWQAEQFHFGVLELGLLGFVMNSEGVNMELY